MPTCCPQNPLHPGLRSLRVCLSRWASPSSPALLPVLDLSLAVLPRSTRMFWLFDRETQLQAPAPAPTLPRMFCKDSNNFQEASPCALRSWDRRNLQGQGQGWGCRGRVPLRLNLGFLFPFQTPGTKTKRSKKCPPSMSWPPPPTHPGCGALGEQIDPENNSDLMGWPGLKEAASIEHLLGQPHRRLEARRRDPETSGGQRLLGKM